MNNLFNTQKRIKVQYSIIDTHELQNFSLGIWQNIYKSENYNKDFGCPAVSSVNSRMYQVNSPLKIKIIFGLDDSNEVFYRYEYDTKLHPTNDEMHKFIDSIFHVELNDKRPTFQILLPYAFITDDDVELITTEPNLKTENVSYVSGALNIKNWIRNVNSAWTVVDLDKDGIIYLDVDKPIIKYLFSRPINLFFKELSKDQINYYKNNRGIANIRRNINSIYNSIIKRRPKKLL